MATNIQFIKKISIMRRIVLSTYSTKEYRKCQYINSITAKWIGKFDKIFEYQENDFEEWYRNKHKLILEKKKGAGLWLWKPYFLNRTIGNIEFGDYLFHCDTASYFIRSVKPLIRQMNKLKHDVMVFSLPLIELEWTKPSLFSLLEIPQEYKNQNQITGSFFIIRKTEETVKFILEWLSFCEKIEFIDCDYIKEHEISKSFIDHRYDQSILSLLCTKYKLKSFRDPSQYGEFPEMYRKKGSFRIPDVLHSDYKTVIILYRIESLVIVSIKYLVKKFLKKYFKSLYSLIINR